MTALEPLTLDLGIKVTATGLEGPVTEPDAFNALTALRRTGAAWRWIVGDLVLAIAAAHPDGMAHALQTIAGLDIDDPASLAKSITVARLIPHAHRRPTLTWTHHATVLTVAGNTPIEPGDTRDQWLTAAAEHRWTVDQLAHHIASADQTELDLGEQRPRPFRLPAAMTAAGSTGPKRAILSAILPSSNSTSCGK